MSMSLMLNDASAQRKNTLDAHAIRLLSTTALHECSLKSFF
jgi:hypothetical protein